MKKTYFYVVAAVAEMGSGNSPIDMITLSNGNNSYLMMANTKHPVAKVNYKNIASFEGTLTQPVKGTAGVKLYSFATHQCNSAGQIRQQYDPRFTEKNKR